MSRLDARELIAMQRKYGTESDEKGMVMQTEEIHSGAVTILATRNENIPRTGNEIETIATATTTTTTTVDRVHHRAALHRHVLPDLPHVLPFPLTDVLRPLLNHIQDQGRRPGQDPVLGRPPKTKPSRTSSPPVCLQRIPRR